MTCLDAAADDDKGSLLDTFLISGVDRSPEDHNARGGLVDQNTEICRGVLRTGFRSSDRRRYSGSLLTRSGSNFANNNRGPRSSSREGAPRRLSTLPTLIQLLTSYGIEWYDDL